jgi:heat shock protein HtpX
VFGGGMSLILCGDCGNEISKHASECPKCGGPVRQSLKYADMNFDKVNRDLTNKSSVTIGVDNAKRYKWFVLANAAILLTLVFLFGKQSDLSFFVLVIALGGGTPFVTLHMSKWLAIKSHKIRVLTEECEKNEAEEQLLNLVNCLSKKVNLDSPPEVGIYESKDMNAFATGKNKEDSLIAFSSQLLVQMDEDAITAVAAHEMAHIVNGDMATMTIVQAVVNAFILFVTLPLAALKLFALFSEDFGWVEYLIVTLFKFLIVTVMLFLGNMVVKAFSRKREFEADRLAATLVDPKRMIHALNALNSQEEISFPAEQASYAAFKISSPPAILDILSTHPSIERRIEALQNI